MYAPGDHQLFVAHVHKGQIAAANINASVGNAHSDLFGTVLSDSLMVLDQYAPVSRQLDQRLHAERFFGLIDRAAETVCNDFFILHNIASFGKSMMPWDEIDRTGIVSYGGDKVEKGRCGFFRDLFMHRHVGPDFGCKNCYGSCLGGNGAVYSNSNSRTVSVLCAIGRFEKHHVEISNEVFKTVG